MPEHAPTDLPDAATLAELASDLLTAHAPDAPEPPYALALRAGWGDDRAGSEVLALPLPAAGGPGTPPAVSLLCHVRPDPDWIVVGVVVDGWTIPPQHPAGIDWRTGTPEVAPSQHPSRQRVRSIHLVGRSGAAALGLHRDGHDGPEVHAVEADEPGPTGPLPDALRRMFDLRTPRCVVPAIELWAGVWLHAVASLAHRKATWRTVAHLHPAAWCLDEVGVELTLRSLTAAGRALARTRGWDQLQLDAVTSPDAWDILPPADVSAWADAGMFARLVLREVPPLWATHRTAARILPANLIERIDDVLDAWGLDPAHPGERAA